MKRLYPSLVEYRKISTIKLEAVVFTLAAGVPVMESLNFNIIDV